MLVLVVHVCGGRGLKLCLSIQQIQQMRPITKVPRLSASFGTNTQCSLADS